MNAKTTVAEAAIRRLRVAVRGAVQGVGFRPFIYRLATDLELRGWVLNSSEGVFLEVEGSQEKLEEFLRRVERDKPAISFIQSLEGTWLDSIGLPDFQIRESVDGAKTAIVMPDVATCPECLREIFDPTNRRYRYPFTNCTNCGPRFSIVLALPYDRPRTTMAGFAMCPECEGEYHDPADRRFHAQPNACPTCGPHLELLQGRGGVLSTHHEALLQAADAVRGGSILALKGLGGFHLICDARNEDAVTMLRVRKHREEKPFALMFPDLDAVRADCEVAEDEERLLRSPASPIVLLRRRSDSRLPGVLAPGNPYLGAMLPYTPLHHLLMHELPFPVVATSGNLSEEPICIDEHDALHSLRGIADLFLVHNRPIARHVDDSVVRIVAGRELVLRRARGFAPLPVTVRQELPPMIAVGAHQKNVIAAATGHQVFLSQHIGDLETVASLHAFENVIGAFRELYEIDPAEFACDMHPSYLSTQYAERQPVPTVPVQHHYAHVLACMAENELEPPVLGICWDGSGYGLDQTVWGGEFLLVTSSDVRRAAHFRTFLLPGSERAVREPRRVALALLHDVFGDQAWSLDLPPLRAFSSGDLRVVRSMIERGVNAPETSSAGRLFDAVASLAGIRQVCRFEGQAAMELEFAIPGDVANDAYPMAIDNANGKWILDWRPMVRAIVAETPSPVGAVARKFHNTLVMAATDIARRIGEPRVVLTGGCFQNRYLTERLVDELRAAGLKPYWHQRVPPNDGGIALGQIVAAARAAAGAASGGKDVPGRAR